MDPITITIPAYNTEDRKHPWTSTNGLQQLQHISGERSPKLMSLQDDDGGFCRKKSRDPLSHRIIEKRRRDRMNSCLSDLSKLIPVSHLRTGHGRIEKTEIIEMAIKHLKRLQTNADRCKFPCVDESSAYLHQFQNGYQECTSEIMRFLVEVEGCYAGDSLCIRLLNHLRKHCNKLMQDFNGNVVKQEPIDDMELEVTEDAQQKTFNKANSTIHNLPDVRPSLLTFCTDSEKQAKPTLIVSEKKRLVEAIKPINGHNNNNSEMKINQPKQMAQQLNDASTAMPQDSTKSRPVSVASSSSSSTRSDETYKYKKNIKDRFHADLQQNPSSSDSDAGCDTITDKRDSSASNNNDRIKRRQQCDQDFSNLPELIDLKAHPNPPTTGYNNIVRNDFVQCMLPDALSVGRLPMFVLHPNHNFYIPMTIASSIIDSVVDKFNSYLPLLHSVNILVYFADTVNVPESAFRL